MRFSRWEIVLRSRKEAPQSDLDRRLAANAAERRQEAAQRAQTAAMNRADASAVAGLGDRQVPGFDQRGSDTLGGVL